jgi:hypothetical protein
MSQKKTISRLDCELHISQMTDLERAALFRAVLSQQMRILGKRVNNLCEKKRAKVSIGQKRRWQLWREQREAERQRIIKENGYAPDWTPPKKPKKPKLITRREAIEIGYQELIKAFPSGMNESNKAQFMAFVPKDPRLKPFL